MWVMPMRNESEPMRILLVEDDQTLGSFLQQALQKQGYSVDWFQDGESAILALQTLDFLLYILDINLPKATGLEILRTLRARRDNAPVLLLTARDTAEQKVEGLDSGADDYLVKPFDLMELLARVRALLRRNEKRSPILRCGAVELDPSACVVKKNNTQVVLTASEYRLLKLLMERADKYTTKSAIEYALYDTEDLTESNAIEVAIYKLRKKFGSDFIKSMRGVGYMVTT